MTTSDHEFWFDFGSTYSYPAAFQVEGASAGPISWRPFLLGPIFEAWRWREET